VPAAIVTRSIGAIVPDMAVLLAAGQPERFYAGNCAAACS
jgi:hypothetical protein